jgi:plasmid stabilization system protein ParE
VIKLSITEAAALSIVEQANYYQEASDLSLAHRWESAVDGAVHALLHLPLKGTPCRFDSPELAGLRWVLVPGFPKQMVFYRFLQDENILLIVNVIYGARDLETLLASNT